MLLVIHVVRSGETLWQIANRYDVNMNSIVQLNGLPNPNQLLIGQSLVIPVPGTSHIVKSGDTLWSISQQYGVTINSIIQANQLTNPNVLYPGTTLLIPPRTHIFTGGNIMANRKPLRNYCSNIIMKIKLKIQILFIRVRS